MLLFFVTELTVFLLLGFFVTEMRFFLLLSVIFFVTPDLFVTEWIVFGYWRGYFFVSGGQGPDLLLLHCPQGDLMTPFGCGNRPLMKEVASESSL